MTPGALSCAMADGFGLRGEASAPPCGTSTSAREEVSVFFCGCSISSASAPRFSTGDVGSGFSVSSTCTRAGAVSAGWSSIEVSGTQSICGEKEEVLVVEGLGVVGGLGFC